MRKDMNKKTNLCFSLKIYSSYSFIRPIRDPLAYRGRNCQVNSPCSGQKIECKLDLAAIVCYTQ